MKKVVILITIVNCMLWAYAQGPYRYRVNLTDKSDTEYSLSSPGEFLSEKALQRRARQGLSIDSTDLPVCQSYVMKIAEKGVDVILCSKWNNSVLIQCADTSCMEDIVRLPFVKKVRKVWACPSSVPLREEGRKKLVTDKYIVGKNAYGAASCQVKMLNVDRLHELGFKGKGMTVAVIDGGFYNVDAVKLLKKVKIEGTRNFVNDFDVYGESDHGLKVLSCMAANEPKVMVGTAPEASYWLLCSEDSDSEYLVEEDYWAGAVEFADSVGVDVVNTSLGYSSFDDKNTDYTYSQLDGRTSLMSKSASMAADKGMIVVCSAGNEGNKVWKKITIPADADQVLAVGAVDRRGMNTLFSSVGNTADGRVKPDVMALGGHSAIVTPEGTTGWVNGTSFAAPTLCGAVVCLWQVCPELTAKQLIDLVRKAGNRADEPDNVFGYGIPDFWKAYQAACRLANEKIFVTDSQGNSAGNGISSK